MSYISKINPETTGEKEKKVIEEHLAQGYKFTNEKLTLLHNAEAFNAIEASSYASGQATFSSMPSRRKTTVRYAARISESF